MKKILVAAMAATMFAACTQNEEVENLSSNKEMKFNTAVMATTKAGVMTNANFNKFTLYAYTGAENTAIIKGEVFNGPTWAPATVGAKFYWPGTQDVNFYGYSVETMANVAYDATTVTAPTLSYIVKETAATQEDLLVAKKSQNSTTGTNVAIPFTHALTRMSFKIVPADGTTTDVKYTIESMKVKAKATGTYTLSTAVWTTTDTNTDFALTVPASPILGGTAAQAISETLMMIPQDATLEVQFTVSVPGFTTETITKTFTFKDWAAGSNIAYTVKLPADSVKEIVVSGELTDGDWNTTPATETPVQ